jgi:hypothetical protein
MDKRRKKRRYDKVPVSFSLEREDAEFLKTMPNRSEWLQGKVAEERAASGLEEGEDLDTAAVEKMARDHLEEIYGNPYNDFSDEESHVRAMNLGLWWLVGGHPAFEAPTDDPVMMRAVFNRVRDLLAQKFRKKWKRSPPTGWDKVFRTSDGAEHSMTPFEASNGD